MVIAKIKGGLGNQMFQYAFAAVAAKTRKEKLVLDISYYQNHPTRSFMLDEFNIRCDKKIKNKFFASVFNNLIHSEAIKDGGLYKPTAITGKKSVLIDGFWESYKYFLSEQDFIKQIFRLSNPSLNFLESVEKIDRKRSIAVHIRRGDFLDKEDPHFNLDARYYSDAVSLIAENKKISDPLVTIFSDDPNWCQENIKNLGGYPVRIFNAKVSVPEELLIMANFGYNCLSNSTFGWWAAWLNDYPDKMVVAPKKWLKDESANRIALENLIFPDWKLI